MKKISKNNDSFEHFCTKCSKMEFKTKRGTGFNESGQETERMRRNYYTGISQLFHNSIIYQSQRN